MVALIQDPQLEQELIAKRRETGADRYDEVWEGVYVMSPTATMIGRRTIAVPMS